MAAQNTLRRQTSGTGDTPRLCYTGRSPFLIATAAIRNLRNPPRINNFEFSNRHKTPALGHRPSPRPALPHSALIETSAIRNPANSLKTRNMEISNRDISGVLQPASIRPPRATLIENLSIRIPLHLIENKRQTQILIENFSPCFIRRCPERPDSRITAFGARDPRIPNQESPLTSHQSPLTPSVVIMERLT